MVVLITAAHCLSEWAQHLPKLIKVKEYIQQRNKMKLTFLMMLSIILFVQEINLVHVIASMEHNKMETLAWLHG